MEQTQKFLEHHINRSPDLHVGIFEFIGFLILYFL